MGTIELSPLADLEHVRTTIDSLFNNKGGSGAGGITDTATANNNNGIINGSQAGEAIQQLATADATNSGSDNHNEGAPPQRQQPHTLDVTGGGNDFLSTATPGPIRLSSEWCFVDSCTAERFFRVDRAQEHLHYLTDIANESLYILDQDSPTMPPTPEDEMVVQTALMQRQQQQANLSPSESR